MQVKEICVEVGENGEFLNISSFISVSQPSNSKRAIKLCIYSKCYNCKAKNLITIQQIDTIEECFVEKAFLLPDENSFKDSKVSFFLCNTGVFKVASEFGSSFTLQIQPRLKFPSQKSILLQEICIQTVVPKWMGPLVEWEKHFAKLDSHGFNAMYLLPIQEFGSSGSPFSITNHHGTFLNGGMSKLKSCMQIAREKYGISSVADVVLNHASKEAPWLMHHPECAFNLQNTPALCNAYALECVLLDFSMAISPFQPTAQNIDWLMEELARNISTRLDFATSDFVHRVIRNVKAAVTWERIEKQPNQAITIDSPMVPNYFTILNSTRKEFIVANNGWTFGVPKSDSIDVEAYLYRELFPWTDCVKLNYGSCEENNPWLWNYMRIYIEELAGIFDGIRLDNCHSTPLNVAKWMLNHARLQNPSLIVVAELFTNSKELDYIYVSQLGINLLTRECLAFHQPSDYVGYNFSKFSIGQPLGAFKRRFHSGPLTLLMDCTHDNATPLEKRSLFDCIPNMAICSFYNAAIGSTMGYDDLNDKKYDITLAHVENYMQKSNTIGKLRKLLNDLHVKMVQEHAEYSHSECIEGKVVKITRSNDKSGISYTLFAYSVFDSQGHPIKIHLDSKNYSHSWAFHAYLTNEGVLEIKKFSSVLFNDFFLLAGSILVIKSKAKFQIPKFSLSTLNFNLYQLNILLFRHSSEEKKAIDWESYHIPGWGNMFYCGFQSAFDVFSEAFTAADLEHPICLNVREGNWFAEWLVQRLSKYQSCFESEEFQKLLLAVNNFPVGYRPLYLYKCIRAIYNALRKRALELMNVLHRHSFVQHLAMTSVQLIGALNGSGLKEPIEKDHLHLPQDNDEGGMKDPIPASTPNWTASEIAFNLPFANASLSAGLPHFSTECYRCWGRDTFVSFRGIFLLLGRFEDAKMHILAFASCMKDGMIPNLLDAGRFPRFNSRDSTWWFLNAVREYCEAVGNSEILYERVEMRFVHDFLTDKSTQEKLLTSCCSTYTLPSVSSNQSLQLIEIILIILRAHWNGINLQEDYPFPDDSMQAEGKQISIYTCKLTGFIYGGNMFNAGTWMDKMNNHDTTKMPSTPSCGSNVEIVALCFSFLEWFTRKEEGKEFEHWKMLIQTNFESNFYAPQLGYFYDTLPLERMSQTNELRPNFIIAMAIAPTLFSHQKQAIESAEKQLFGPLGIKTLAPSHAKYHSTYNSQNHPSTAYHNGPEWLWAFGEWIKARIRVSLPVKLSLLKAHWKMICESPAKGLVELTNADGEACESACMTQAWSNAVFQEVLHDLGVH
jgi:glycogen debranching enzyme